MAPLSLLASPASTYAVVPTFVLLSPWLCVVAVVPEGSAVVPLQTGPAATTRTPFTDMPVVSQTGAANPGLGYVPLSFPPAGPEGAPPPPPPPGVNCAQS